MEQKEKKKLVCKAVYTQQRAFDANWDDLKINAI